MASTHRTKRKLGWLLTCLLIAGFGCDDDTAADTALDHDTDHSSEHGAAGSGEEGHDHNAMVGPATGAECPSDSTLTYDNFGKQFMENYCLRCHSTSVTGDARHDAPDDHNFDTIDDIQLLAPHIDQLAGSGPDSTNEKMPASGDKPSLEERQKLSEWLACGAQES